MHGTRRSVGYTAPCIPFAKISTTFKNWASTVQSLLWAGVVFVILLLRGVQQLVANAFAAGMALIWEGSHAKG